MNKKLNLILTLVFTMSIVLASICISNAWSEYARVQDFAEVMTEEERNQVETYLGEKAQALKFDMVIVTCRENISSDEDMMATADDFYDKYGYGYSDGQDRDGCILLIDFESRNIWISTRGYGITALTDYGIQYLISEMSTNLADGKYVEAFTVNFADNIEWMVKDARDGNPYDVPVVTTKDKLTNPGLWVRMIIVSLIIGLIYGSSVARANKRKLKSVEFKHQAQNYVRKGSLNITGESDRFLYSNIVRTAKPKTDNNSGGSTTHVSGSGATHGGGGGKF